MELDSDLLGVADISTQINDVIFCVNIIEQLKWAIQCFDAVGLPAERASGPRKRG